MDVHWAERLKKEERAAAAAELALQPRAIKVEQQLATVEQDLREALRAARALQPQVAAKRVPPLRAQLEIVARARQQAGNVALVPGSADVVISLPALKHTRGAAPTLRLGWAEETAGDGGIERLSYRHGDRQRLKLHFSTGEPPAGRADSRPAAARQPSAPRGRQPRGKVDRWVRPASPPSRAR